MFCQNDSETQEISRENMPQNPLESWAFGARARVGNRSEKNFILDPRLRVLLFCLLFHCSCSSNTGRIGGRQVISVGSMGTEFSDRSCMTPTPYGSNVTITCLKGNILHEIGHALGYYHEHNRPDRDEYLTVVWKNVIPGNKTFTTYTSDGVRLTSFTTERLEYDNRKFNPGRYKKKNFMISTIRHTPLLGILLAFKGIEGYCFRILKL